MVVSIYLCYFLKDLRILVSSMKKEDIITLPNKHLRQKSKKIHVITDEVKKLISDMTSAAIDWEESRPHEISAALAAVQVDKLERIVIVRSEFDNKNNNPIKIFFICIPPKFYNPNAFPSLLGSAPPSRVPSFL